MSDEIDELEVARAIAHAKSWLKRLEPGAVVDPNSGFTSDDLFVLAYTISSQSPVVFALPPDSMAKGAIFTGTRPRATAA